MDLSLISHQCTALIVMESSIIINAVYWSEIGLQDIAFF